MDVHSQVDKQDRSLTRADVEVLLHQAGSSDKLKLIGLNLKGINLTNFNLTETDLRGADLRDAILRNAILNGASLRGADLYGADLYGADLRDADLYGADLNGADLRGADLYRVDLHNANLRGAIPSGAILSGAILNGADLRDVDLSRAILNGADLRDADLSRANLRGADLLDADLSGAILSDANLSDANLRDADFSRAILSRAILSDANLSDANLSGADLRGVDLRGAILSKVQLGVIGAKLISDDLSEVRGLDEPIAVTTENTSTFRIRIREEPLTPPTLTSLLFAITDLSTKCWLIAHERFADLIEYTQTHDVRFVEEAQLTFTRITYNSPFDASFKLDLSASNVADAIITTIDAVAQRKQRLEKVELENKEKAQEIEHAKQKADLENKAALLEQERQELTLERERLEILEKRLEVQKKGILYAFEIATQAVTVLQPNADEQTRVMLIQTLIPTVLQLQNGKGLELVLPTLQRNEEKAVKPEDE